jgi:hypothetical protein
VPPHSHRSLPDPPSQPPKRRAGLLYAPPSCLTLVIAAGEAHWNIVSDGFAVVMSATQNTSNKPKPTLAHINKHMHAC